MTVKQYLHQYSYQWVTILSTGFTLFLVLYIYKGYNIQTGLSFSGHSHIVRSLAFGILTSIVFFGTEFYLSKWFNLSQLKGKVFFKGLSIFLGANMTFLLFNYFWNWTEWYWSSYTLLVWEYFFVVTIPIVLIELYHLKTVSIENVTIQPDLKFIAENGKQFLSLKPQNLLYIQSAGNYVEIMYLSNQQVKKHLLRSSLKQIEQTMETYDFLKRCHRSYLVNTQKISQIKKTNTALELDLEYATVPVSKKYEEVFSL